jgi:Ion channel
MEEGLTTTVWLGSATTYLLGIERRLNVALLLVVVLHVAIVSAQLGFAPETPIRKVWVVPLLLVALVFAALKVLCLLSPRRVKHFGGMEIVVFLALYGLTVLVFASLYHEAYLANPNQNVFHLSAGSDIAGMKTEIERDLQVSSEDPMAAASKNYRLAESKAFGEATECFEVPPNPAMDPAEKYKGGLFEFPEHSCVTREALRVELLERYTNHIDKKLVAAYAQLQQHRASHARLTYVDFLYFSAVTGATVGYGDITPNTAETKLLVIGHIATSLFLTLVLVNLIVNPAGKDAGSGPQVQRGENSADA